MCMIGVSQITFSSISSGTVSDHKVMQQGLPQDTGMAAMQYSDITNAISSWSRPYLGSTEAILLYSGSG